jgi:two-component system NtrC family sensor kinase
MKIRDKIFVGVGAYVFLAALIGFFAYRELRTVTTRVNVVELANEMTHNIGEARRFEKNYLLYQQPEDREEFKRNLALLSENLDTLRLEIAEAMGPDVHRRIKEDLSFYDLFFDEVGNIQRSKDDKLATLVAAEKRIEARLEPGSHRAYTAVRDRLRTFLLDESARSHDALVNSMGSLRKYGSDFRAYQNAVDDLNELYRLERETVQKMREIARQIQQFFRELAAKERQAIHVTMSRSVTLLLIALLTAVVLGAIVNTKLAMSIAAPLRRMERFTKRIAEGDFSEKLEVTGNDEIASLGRSFNRMEEKLIEARAALENTITQLRAKKMELVEAEKLAAIGKLASGIAHEISNPLTSVMTFSNLMLEKTPPDHPDYGKLRMMVRETERARDIVRQLLSFGREIPINPVSMTINGPVNDALQTLVAQKAFDGIRVSVTLADGLPHALIDHERIRQVVSNILINAIHAITPPGTIEVSTGVSDGFVEVIISDTGKGIPHEHLNKIFDPFFTTKDKTKGTGLGLAVSYGIIKKHGGCIEVMSQVGKGSTFTVRLPIHG